MEIAIAVTVPTVSIIGVVVGLFGWLRSDMRTLRGDMHTLRGDMHTLVQGLSEKLDGLDRDHRGLDRRLARIEGALIAQGTNLVTVTESTDTTIEADSERV